LSVYSSVGSIDGILLDVDWNRTLDLDPDIFYFSFGTYSGKFFYDQRVGSFKVQSVDDVKIESIGQLEGWRVTTPDGSVYYFGVKDISDTTPIKENNVQTGYTYRSNGQTSPVGQLENYVTTWHLRRVVTPNNREIKLTY